jgi:diacylglycerol kinase (ATP)
MTAKVIHNPYANRWRSRERLGEAEAALRAAGIEYDLVSTERPGHGTLLAEEAVLAGFTPIIAAGGDGSISEVVNGMMRAAEKQGAGLACCPLGILPLGSANDLVVNLHLPVDLESAAMVIAAGAPRRIDLGQVIHGEQRTPRYFDNNSALGLEPTVTLIQQRITWLRGTLRYLLATLIAVMQKPSWTAHMEWESGEYTGPVSLITVGNTPLTGGLFYMTPHALPVDGKLTFVYGYLPTRRQILQTLPRTMKPGAGSYVEHPAIHEVHSPWLRIQVEQPSPLHADGEIQTTEARAIEYQILPARLPVLMPA